MGQVGTATHDVTITEPASNNAPTAVIASGTCTTTNTTCTMSATGSSDPDTAAGDGIRNYVWTWGDGTPDTTGTSASQTHVFTVAGTYTVTLRVLDKWGHSSAPVTHGCHHCGGAGRQPAPTVVFTARLHRPHLSGEQHRTTDTDGGIRSDRWNWGDAHAATP